MASKSNPLKILYFALVELELPGGPTVHVINLLKGFNALGYQIFLIVPKPRKPVSETLPVAFRGVPFFGFSKLRLQFFYLLSFFALLYESFRMKPDYWMIRESEKNGIISLAGWLSRRPVLVEVNGPISGGRLCRKLQFKMARAVVTNSEGLRRQLMDERMIKQKKSFVVSMHVDVKRFRPIAKEECRVKLGFTSMKRILGYVGTFQPTHEIQGLLDTMEIWLKEKKFSEADMPHLVLVGGGNDEAFYREKVLQQKLEKWVHFTGWIFHDQTPLYINAFDLGIALLKPEKRYATEAFLKIKEYIACGVPVVVNECDRKLFQDYPASSLTFVNPDPPSEMAKTLYDLLQKPPKDTQKGVEFITKFFSVEKAAEEINQFMKSRI